MADGTRHLDRLRHTLDAGDRPGIDNVVFISILVGKLPTAQQARARQVGLRLALVMHILLLLTLSWVIGPNSALFSLIGHEISGRDLILILGGLFLLGKSTYEIHDRLEGEEGHATAPVVVPAAPDTIVAVPSKEQVPPARTY